jgi:hypothetical protein
MFQALFPGIMMQGPMDLLLTLQQRQWQRMTQMQQMQQPQMQAQTPSVTTNTTNTTNFNDTDETFTFTQSTASASWTINHNLGQFPAVTVVDNTGKVVIADVQYVNSNQIVVSFATPFAGKAYLNV